MNLRTHHTLLHNRFWFTALVLSSISLWTVSSARDHRLTPWNRYGALCPRAVWMLSQTASRLPSVLVMKASGAWHYYDHHYVRCSISIWTWGVCFIYVCMYTGIYIYIYT